MSRSTSHGHECCDLFELESESDLAEKSFLSNSTRHSSSTDYSSHRTDSRTNRSHEGIIAPSPSATDATSSQGNSNYKEKFAERSAFQEWTRAIPTFSLVLTLVVFVGILFFFLFHALFGSPAFQVISQRAPVQKSNQFIKRIVNSDDLGHLTALDSETTRSRSKQFKLTSGQHQPNSQTQNLTQIEKSKVFQENIADKSLDVGVEYNRNVRQSLKEHTDDSSTVHFDGYEGVPSSVYDFSGQNQNNTEILHLHLRQSASRLIENLPLEFGVGEHFNSRGATTIVGPSSNNVTNGKHSAETFNNKLDKPKHLYLLGRNPCMIPNVYSDYQDSTQPDLRNIWGQDGKAKKCTSQKTTGTPYRKDCCYQIIKGETHNSEKDDFWKTLVCTPFDPEDKESLAVLENLEFVRIRCKAALSSDWIKTEAQTEFRAHVSLKSKVVRDKIQYWIDQRSNGNGNPHLHHKKPLNILILGLISVSRQAFLKFLPQTRDLLLNTHNFIEMKGHHISGSKMLDNIIPLLMGIEKYQLSSVCNHRWKSFWDECPFIWKNFNEANYTTLYAEDLPDIFNYGNQGGFKKKPVDYFLRPLLLAKSQYDGDTHCFGNKTTTQVILSYLKEFVLKFNYFGVPSFSFTFLKGRTQQPQQERMRNASTMKTSSLGNDLDVELFPFFQKLMQNKSILENTLFILLSSQGEQSGKSRTNYQHGYLNHRLPLFLIKSPASLAAMHPELAEATHILESNSIQVTTPFDIHATLKFILSSQLSLKLNPTKGKPIQTTSKKCGFHLFESFKNRTCRQACIDIHWCTCNVSIEQMRENSIDVPHSPYQQSLFDFIHANGIISVVLEKLNEMAKLQKESLMAGHSRYKHCPELIFKRILYIGTSWSQRKYGDMNFSYLSTKSTINENDFIIVGVEVLPTDAQFEIILQTERDEWIVVPPIIRTDSSAGYTFCINLNKSI